MRNWDLEVILLQENGTKKNKIGDTVPTYLERPLLAYEKPIPRSEYYLAGNSNLKLEKQIIVHPFEYEEEQLVIINGTKYQVEKHYKLSNEELELTLVAKKGNTRV